MMDIPTSEVHKMTIEEFDATKLLINATRQRDRRNFNAFPVIDIDCRHHENESMKDIVEFFGETARKLLDIDVGDPLADYQPMS